MKAICFVFFEKYIKRHAPLLLLVSMACLLYPAQTLASEHADLRIGPGVVITSQPYEGISEKVIPIPFIVYRKGPLEFRGISLSYDLLKFEDWSVFGLLSWRFDGYDADDSTALEGMGNRSDTLDAGFGFAKTFDLGKITITGVADTLNKHQGFELSADYSLFLPAGDWLFLPFVGAKYQNSDLGDYYYGVRQAEATPGRARYDGSAAVNWFTGAGFRYEIDDDWQIFGRAQYQWLSNRISDSPIVDQNYKTSLILGLTYRF